MKKIVLLSAILYLLTFSNFCYSQAVGVSSLGSIPDASSLFDINATGMNPKGGLLVPRLNTTERNAIPTPVQSLIIYNTTTKCFEFFENTVWQPLMCTCTAPSAPTAGTHTPSQTQVVWNWNTVSGATGYKWNTVNNYSTATDNAASTTYTQTSLTCNTAYTLYVWAYTSACNSTVTTLTQTTSACCSLPSVPTASTHTPSQTQIVWNWNTASGATGYKWNTVNTYSSAADVATSTTYTQTSLTCNTAYTLYVWAYNACGNSTVATLSQATNACASPCSYNSSSSFTDARDSKVYAQVQVGTQCWMAENLNYSTSGTFTNWGSGQSAAGTQKACYNDDPANCAIYGGLYNWYEALDGVNVNNTSAATCNGTGAGQPACNTPVQGICPSGWHVPSHYEWVLLERTICTSGSCVTDFPYDMTTTGWRGTNEGSMLKEVGTSHWTTPNSCSSGCNTTGFTGLPGGELPLYGFGTEAGYTSSTEYNSGNSWMRELYNTNSTIMRGDVGAGKGVGRSVRCVKTGFQTTTYTTAGTYTYAIPAGMANMTVKAWGGGGATGGQANGGGGGFATRTISVTPGNVVTIIVGGPGVMGTGGINAPAGGAGGYGGGGKGGDGWSSSSINWVNAGGGGGRSEISISSTVYVVAGGGGGGGGNSRHGGGGGGSTGLSATNNVGCLPDATGGTQATGGTGGGTGTCCCSNVGANGAANTGGKGGNAAGADGAPGGGGGGGYYGGGGGGGGAAGQWGAGAGGGSSYAPGGSTTAGTNLGVAGNEADTDWAANAGRMDNAGRVVLICY